MRKIKILSIPALERHNTHQLPRDNVCLLDEANADRFAFWAFFQTSHEKLTETLSVYRRILATQPQFSDSEKQYRVALLDDLAKAVQSGDLRAASIIDFLSHKFLLIYAVDLAVIGLNIETIPVANVIYTLVAAIVILMVVFIRERCRRAATYKMLSSFRETLI